MDGPNTNEPNANMASDLGLSAYPMTAGHIEIQAVTEAVRDISIDLIRLRDVIADQSSRFPEDQKAVLYNNVEVVSRTYKAISRQIANPLGSTESRTRCNQKG